MQVIKSWIKKIAYYSVWFLCTLLPVNRKKVVIMNFQGTSYGGHPKYIAEALGKIEKDCRIICVLKNAKDYEKLPAYIEGVKFYSLKYLYHFATAGVWVDSCRKMAFLKRKNQLYLQTWHGLAMKKIESDATNSISKKYIKSAIRDSKHIDLILSDSNFMTSIIKKAFWYDGPIYQIGFPSYDMLYSDPTEIKRKILNYYDLEKECRFVLYAPTFRADLKMDAYNVDWERQLKNLSKRFGGKFVALIHLHPNVANVADRNSFGKNVIDCTFYPDMQELILASDIMIGDYSSVNFDFSITGKPVFRYCSDLDMYMNDRNTYFDFEAYPWPYSTTNDELEKTISEFDANGYAELIKDFYDKIGFVYEDKSAYKVASLLKDYINSDMLKDEFVQSNKDIFIW